MWGAVLLVAISLVYALGLLLASRRTPRSRRTARHAGAPPSGDELFFIFMLPCLNEAAVIARSVERLLSIPGGNFAVLVIDDASDDDTSAVVLGLGDSRVWVLRRSFPNARQGKGEALNAGIRYLQASGLLEGRDPDRVIAVVVDADGRLEPGAVSDVVPYFADPTVGGVQIGVRINNRPVSTLARMQDMEFVIFGEVYQRGRRHLGSVGLGGNGQFMRLSALLSLGGAPWSPSLAEDLDLGIRLLCRGWHNEFCSTAAVHQQGVVELRRLIRQRSRWFQGHMQAWRLIPKLVDTPYLRSRADLMYHLSSPALLLVGSLLTGAFVLSLCSAAVTAARGGDPLGWWLATAYALSFAPALVFSTIYWKKERAEGLGLLHAWGLAHVYVIYQLMWYPAGWWAVGRTLRGTRTWAKTDRVAESPPPAGPAIDRPTGTLAESS